MKIHHCSVLVRKYIPFLSVQSERSGKAFFSANRLPAYRWVFSQAVKEEASAHEKCDPFWKSKNCDPAFWLCALFQLLLIGKKRLHTLITSGLFTTWLSCPTDVCFGSKQHEHMTGRQTIILGSFIPLVFQADLVTQHQMPLKILYSFGK